MCFIRSAKLVACEHLAYYQTGYPKPKCALLKSSRSSDKSSIGRNNEIKALYASQYEVRPNKTYIFPSPGGLAIGNDSHEVPFYRVNALSSDGFIGEGSNGTRKRGRISASTFCFFTGAKVSSSPVTQGCWELGDERLGGEGSPPPVRRPRKTNFAIRIRLREIWKLRFKGRKMTRRWRAL